MKTLLINQTTRQTLRRINHRKKCPCCNKQNLSGTWLIVTIDGKYSGYNCGNLTILKNAIGRFQGACSMKNSKVSLDAAKHCFICGTDITYKGLMYHYAS